MHGLPGFRYDPRKYAVLPSLFTCATNDIPTSSLTYTPVSCHKYQGQANIDTHLFDNTIVHTAYSAIKVIWITHGFSSGTIFDSIKSNSLPYVVHDAVDTTISGRAMLQSFSKVPTIFPTSLELILYKSNVCPDVHAYFNTVPLLWLPSDQRLFFKYQLDILYWLQQSRKMIIFICQYHSTTCRTACNTFEGVLKSKSWLLSTQCLEYTDFGDAIADMSSFLFGVNKLSLGPDASSPIQIIHPPIVDTTITNHIIGT